MTVYGPLSPKYGREGRPRRRRTIKSVKKSCDDLWSALIRSKGSCEWCGGSADNAHHVVGRKNHRLRFEPRNGVCLCYACHRKVHHDPRPFVDWFRSVRYEDDDFLAVETQKGPIGARNLHAYLELEKSLSQQLKERLDGADRGSSLRPENSGA